MGTIDKLQTDYISAAFMYDDGKLLVLGEIANLSADDTVQPVGDAGYLTVGYRFGKWMPHITYAKFQTDAKNDKQIRAMQAYVDSVGRASYNAALGLNTFINPGFGAGGSPGIAISSSACTQPAPGCDGTVLAQMSARDTFLQAAQGYGVDIYNNLESQIQQQQSVTLGLTYDVTPRVKAKAQVTHYEGFGDGVYQSIGATQVNSATTMYSGFNQAVIDGNGRFIGEPGAVGNHTAIYSLSIDAVF